MQPSLFSRIPTPRAARVQRDQALAKVDPAWVRLAAACVTTWAWQTHADRSPWLLEEARAAYEDAGLPAPRDGRWWGGVPKALAKAGTIEQCGYGRAKSSRLSPKVLWRLR